MWGGGDYKLYLSLHCHHRNDFCIKMGSDESRFNVSLIVRDKVTRQCPQTTTFEEKGEPKRYRTGVLPLTSKSREAELSSHGQSDCLAAESFLNSCFSDIVFVTLFRAAVETAVSGVVH